MCISRGRPPTPNWSISLLLGCSAFLFSTERDRGTCPAVGHAAAAALVERRLGALHVVLAEGERDASGTGRRAPFIRVSWDKS